MNTKINAFECPHMKMKMRTEESHHDKMGSPVVSCIVC